MIKITAIDDLRMATNTGQKHVHIGAPATAPAAHMGVSSVLG